MNSQIPALLRVFCYLSILTVGGGMAAFPEMEELTVKVHHWLEFHQLIHLYSVGQLAPGPNMMMIVAIGDWAGGILGAVVVLIAFFGPTALLALIIGRLWTKLETWPWRTGGIALSVLLIMLWRKINPALLVLGGAVVGGIVFMPK